MSNDEHEGRAGSRRPSRPIGELAQVRLSRRAALRTTAAAVAVLAQAEMALPTSGRAAASDSTLTFPELERGYDEKTHVAPGYEEQVLVRWGDPIVGTSAEFDGWVRSAEEQEKRFGFNCDFVAYLPLPRGSNNSSHGLLCVNHEYSDARRMFPGLTDSRALRDLLRDRVDIELAAHGHSVVEIERVGSKWRLVAESKLNRRLSALSTWMQVSGPAAGHPRLRTGADPSGRRVLGTLNNCAGGVTPWGTILTGEENFHQYFSGDAASTSEARNHARYGVGGTRGSWSAWARHHGRFDLAVEPNEPNRFGWVVEFDPYDPSSVPVKRTALGRVKHEGASVALDPDGRVVVYMGDDERFEYLYRFVSRRTVERSNSRANIDLLDDGTLTVARFEEDGTLVWLPLVHGNGPLHEGNGFSSQADILIETRRAADLLGATPMDRPEDIEVSARTGRVYVMLTNNTERDRGRVDGANPRPANRHGHILELLPPGGPEHGAPRFQWEVFLRGGDPRRPEDGAEYHPAVSQNGWLSCPDNCAIDPEGRLWITTDGAPKSAGMADGVYGCDTIGAGRGLTRLLYRGPRGAELTGVCFTPDGRTMFVAVQHPGEEEGSTFDLPSTRWPDFRPGFPPRPSVVAITHQGGGPIGS